MKLITELYDAQVVTEGHADGTKKLYVEGVFLQQNVKNRNGRIYPPAVLEREVARYTKELIEANRAWGELGHPNGPGLNLERVSHRVTACRQNGNDFYGKAQILDTPYGKIAESLIQSGGQLGVSSRGMGSLKEDHRAGAKIVQDDFRLAVMIDLVADPSAPNAFVNGVMENVSWRMNELGEWVYEVQEAIKAEVHSTPKAELQEKKFSLWERFLEEAHMSIEAQQMARSIGVDPLEARRALDMVRRKLKASGKHFKDQNMRDEYINGQVRALLGDKRRGR